MVRICEGTTTKQEVLEQSLEQYKEMFIIVKREFNRVVAVSQMPIFAD
jgi:DNA topoisomerase-3